MTDSKKWLKAIKDWYNNITTSVFQETDTTLRVTLMQGKTIIGVAYIVQFPGCCGIGVLTAVRIFEGFMDIGYGQMLTSKCIETAIQNNYTILQATTNQNSPAMDHILLKNGFTVISEFVNKKTENNITQYQLSL